MATNASSITQASGFSWADVVKRKSQDTAVVSESPEPSSCETVPDVVELPPKTDFDTVEDVGAPLPDATLPEDTSHLARMGETQASATLPEDTSHHSRMLPSAPPGVMALQPGSRGGFQCCCRGQVLSMLSHYGWITAFGIIDHPLAAKHCGRIYVHKKDIVDGHSLAVGDTVSFYLYVDNVGLGAEACRFENTEAVLAPLPKLRKEAVEFVPGAACMSGHPTSDAHAPVSDMFVRMSRTFNSIPANGYVEMVGAINSAYFDSDSSSEDGDDDDDAHADADRESLADESDHSCVEVSKLVEATKHAAPWRKAVKVSRESSPERSTSPGMTSDSTNVGNTSESETESKPSQQMVIRLPAGPHTFRPPPGLKAPPGLEGVVPVFIG